ncbi:MULTISPECIES: NACHT domain-containing NTPase [unclassified Crossiella]|uniref:NACHT domain-containing protein n=1 Tax=unclassified Crossiella TaxID=2620835 RepID=UPI001FFFB54E|nr:MULTISPECIES: NACHT domain-containing protein [unclassified Crossiella]MCK2238828.1 NACHT domain-containing protein [Crossiella sp. S99.2]MCK2251602.1 NACHT domain-containing protein [Crossiella sp. S99.1]
MAEPEPDRSHNEITANTVADVWMIGAVHGGQHFYQPVPAPADPLREAAEDLARAVRAQWRAEENRLRISAPFPLPVRWRRADEVPTDHWANIRCRPAGATAGPLPLDGELAKIVEVYRRVPSGRLVVLGKPGSGKTILTLRFVLDLLDNRTGADAVPIIFSLAAWDPTAITLEDWLVSRLRNDYPVLAAGQSSAAELVKDRRVLPVLDGFDEIAHGLHAAALAELNATAIPLLLTGRSEQYAAAVAGAQVLSAAAVVELADLTPADLTAYLPRIARTDGGWAAVLRVLHGNPRSAAGAELAAVLSTPLMVAMVRGVYSDVPGKDPAELLDRGRFGSSEAIETYLIGAFTTAAYQRPPGPGHRRWDPELAEHWLGYLAWHLNRLGKPDLQWWQLGDSLRRRTRALVVGLVSGLATGLMIAVMDTLGTGSVRGLAHGLLQGLLTGIAFGVVHWGALWLAPGALEPARVRMRLRGPPGLPRAQLRQRVRWALAIGLLFGVASACVRQVQTALVLGAFEPFGVLVVDAIVYVPLFGFAGAATALVTGWLETPLDAKAALSPTSLLRTCREHETIRLVVVVPVFLLVMGLGTGAVVALIRAPAAEFGIGVLWDLPLALMVGASTGLSAASGYVLSATAWGQWLALSRVWLPLTGRLPWSLPAFLADAHHRGVLRQAGSAYQFRHARCQDHLAQAYQARWRSTRAKADRN